MHYDFRTRDQLMREAVQGRRPEDPTIGSITREAWNAHVAAKASAALPPAAPAAADP